MLALSAGCGRSTTVGSNDEKVTENKKGDGRDQSGRAQGSDR